MLNQLIQLHYRSSPLIKYRVLDWGKESYFRFQLGLADPPVFR